VQFFWNKENFCLRCISNFRISALRLYSTNKSYKTITCTDRMATYKLTLYNTIIDEKLSCRVKTWQIKQHLNIKGVRNSQNYMVIWYQIKHGQSKTMATNAERIFEVHKGRTNVPGKRNELSWHLKAILQENNNRSVEFVQSWLWR
jgi:hypothetical protein